MFLPPSSLHFLLATNTDVQNHTDRTGRISRRYKLPTYKTLYFLKHIGRNQTVELAFNSMYSNKEIKYPLL